MTRRESLLILPALGIASIWLTACDSKYVEGFQHLKLTDMDLKLIEAIRKSVIPIFDEPKNIEYNTFLLKYVDKIISTKKRNIFNSGFQELKHKLKGELAYDVEDINAETINKFWVDASKSSELIDGFLKIIKQGTVHYYKSEEDYVSNKIGFKLVPGEFQPCVKIG